MYQDIDMDHDDLAPQQAIKCSFLVEHLKSIIHHEGWWYRVSKYIKPEDTSIPDPDVVLPHFGILLGMTEETTNELFKELGLICVMSNNRLTLAEDGWNHILTIDVELQDSLELKHTWFTGKKNKRFTIYVWVIARRNQVRYTATTRKIPFHVEFQLHGKELQEAIVVL